MRWLIDTNVLSEVRKGKRADAGVRRWFAGLTDEELHLSALTVGEIRKGIESVRRRDPRAATSLERWLRVVVHDFADRILPVDQPVAEEWGRLSVPNPLPTVDGLIAATAKVHGLTVATRNIRDIGRTGVDCVNPFAVA